MQTSWEKTEAGTTHYIHVETFNLVVGEHQGSGHTDTAGGCTHEEFLEGRFQREIKDDFGAAVLEEVIAAVREAANIPSIKTARQAIERSNAFLTALPADKTLGEFRRHPETENGYFNYGNAGGYKTTLRSDQAVLTVERNHGQIEDGRGGVQTFALSGHCSAVVEKEDHFFLTHTDHFAHVAPDGRIPFDTARHPDLVDIFGNDLRIKNCFRNEETIFVAYWWFGGVHPDGLLRFTPDSGFTGRFIIE